MRSKPASTKASSKAKEVRFVGAPAEDIAAEGERRHFQAGFSELAFFHLSISRLFEWIGWPKKGMGAPLAATGFSGASHRRHAMPGHRFRDRRSPTHGLHCDRMRGSISSSPIARPPAPSSSGTRIGHRCHQRAGRPRRRFLQAASSAGAEARLSRLRRSPGSSPRATAPIALSSWRRSRGPMSIA